MKAKYSYRLSAEESLDVPVVESLCTCLVGRSAHGPLPVHVTIQNSFGIGNRVATDTTS